MGIGHAAQFADHRRGGVGGCRDLEDFTLGTSADQKTIRRAARREAPEEVGRGRTWEIGEDRAGDEATVGARGEALQVPARDLAEEINLGLLGERLGAEAG